MDFSDFQGSSLRLETHTVLVLEIAGIVNFAQYGTFNVLHTTAKSGKLIFRIITYTGLSWEGETCRKSARLSPNVCPA